MNEKAARLKRRIYQLSKEEVEMRAQIYSRQSECRKLQADRVQNLSNKEEALSKNREAMEQNIMDMETALGTYKGMSTFMTRSTYAIYVQRCVQ